MKNEFYQYQSSQLLEKPEIGRKKTTRQDIKIVENVLVTENFNLHQPFTNQVYEKNIDTVIREKKEDSLSDIERTDLSLIQQSSIDFAEKGICQEHISQIELHVKSKSIRPTARALKCGTSTTRQLFLGMLVCAM